MNINSLREKKEDSMEVTKMGLKEIDDEGQRKRHLGHNVTCYSSSLTVN